MTVTYAQLLETLVKFGLITQEEAEHDYVNYVRAYSEESERLDREYKEFKRTEWKAVPWWRRLFGSSLVAFFDSKRDEV